MFIRAIKITNFMCYRDADLRLEPKVYAVIARRDGDDDSSNWCGKTAFLEAIDFALYGRQRHALADGWITHGEKEGGVRIELDDGTLISRTRKRGKSTRLHLRLPEGHEAHQEEAQIRLNELLGIDSDDFLITCYFQQRQMARLVLATSEERMAIIASWLKLSALQNCEDFLRAEALAKSKIVERVASDLRIVLEREVSRGMTPQNIEDSMVAISLEIEQSKKQIAELQKAMELSAHVAEYEKVIKQGKALRAELDLVNVESVRANLAQSKVTRDEAMLRKAESEAAYENAFNLMRGKFDGKCPVSAAHCECPIAGQINRDNLGSENLTEGAKVQRLQARAKYNYAVTSYEKFSDEMQRVTNLQSQINTLRERLKEIRSLGLNAEVVSQAMPLEMLRAEADRLQNNVIELMRKMMDLKNCGESIFQIQELRQKYLSELAASEKELATYREAAAICGKQGAQRQVAELALLKIQNGANAMLDECSIDLQVAVQWSREGKGLAKTCDACGAPFASSVRVKVCERCNAPRGPLIVNKLDISLSDRSGAAEDLAGAALQLSASDWLRTQRLAAWSVALIDEPFTALDRTHRKSFATHLTRLLSGGGFSQAFIISHTPDTADALPGRILVNNCDGVSSASVVA